MTDFNTWATNYNNILNELFKKFLLISSKNDLNIAYNKYSFNNFCYMIYSNTNKLKYF